MFTAEFLSLIADAGVESVKLPAANDCLGSIPEITREVRVGFSGHTRGDQEEFGIYSVLFAMFSHARGPSSFAEQLYDEPV